VANTTAERALRIVAITLGSLIVLIVLFWLAVWLFVNPNDYKGRIEATVQTSTGRQLSLPGNINLSVFPSISLQLGPASLGNPPGFGGGPFASLQHVSLSVRLLPLLHKQLQIGRVEIDGLDLQLEKNAQGQGNWELSGGAAKTTTAPAAASSTSSTALPEMAGLVIKNGHISYQDEVIDHVAVTVGKVAPDSVIPVEFKLDLTESPGAKPIALAGKLDATLGNDAMRVSNLDVQLDNSTLRGDASIGRGASSPISFDLALDHIDLDRYLSANTTAAKRPAASSSTASTTSTASTASTAIPVDLLKTLNVRGKLTIGNAQLKGLTVSQVDVGLDANGGLMHIAPETAHLYGGTSSGEITLDARSATPVMKLDQRVSGVDVKPLLVDFMHNQRLSGHGDLTMNLTGEGADSNALIRTLSGHVAANLANGAINGADLWFEVRRALALLQRQAPPSGSDQGQTKFDAFRASADVKQGIATTRDLTVASQQLRLTGQGTANLATDAINYQLQVALLSGAPTAAASSAQLTVPVDVTGTFSNFQMRPDVNALAKGQLKNQLQKKLPGLLKGLLGH
jgi:AsmA protein